jgi:hypothetical protein
MLKIDPFLESVLLNSSGINVINQNDFYYFCSYNLRNYYKIRN